MTDAAATEATTDSTGHVEHFEPLDPELPNGYWEYSDGLRANRPVVRSDGHWSTEDTGFWLLSRHDDVYHAAADWQTYSSANGATPVQFPVEMFRMIPLEVDPPLHRHVRRLLNPFFTPEAVAAAEQAAAGIADALLDECVAQEECDFVAGFANLLPAQVFFRYFLDAGDDQSKIPWVVKTILFMFEYPDKALEVAGDLFAWYSQLLAGRQEAGRRDDLIGVIAHAGLDEAGDGFAMDDKQRLETLNMVVLAGMETTSAGLGNIAHHLATNQELRVSLRGADDETLARAVDEFLRHDPPVPLAGRTLTKDVELRGCPMRAGDRIMLNWAGASRDPEVFPNPDVLDFARANVARHSSFGAGVHRCMGNHLARRELKAAIRAIAELGTFELVEGAEVNWRAAFARGPHALPVRIAR